MDKSNLFQKNYQSELTQQCLVQIEFEMFEQRLFFQKRYYSLNVANQIKEEYIKILS